MRNLYLHIGHGKTGSSYIQSCLALSTDILENANIFYPKYGHLELAKKGNISAGNVIGLENIIFSKDSELSIEKSIEKIFNQEKSYLFSGEKLFRQLSKTKHRKSLIKIAELAGFDKIKILLFIRNPIEHASSGYQQMIKRGGKHFTIEDYFKKYDIPLIAEELIQVLQKEEQIELEVLNYSVVKDKLIEKFASWLGLTPELIVKPSNSIVNRSMTIAELELQRKLNMVLGKSGKILSDILCNELPELPADLIVPSEEVQYQTLSRFEQAMTNVNAMIPQSQHYHRDICPESNFATETFTFSSEQLSAIANGLGNQIKYLQEKNQELKAYNQELKEKNQEKFVTLHFYKGRCHQLNNQIDHAIKSFQTVLEKVPNYSQALIYLDECLSLK